MKSPNLQHIFATVDIYFHSVLSLLLLFLSVNVENLKNTENYLLFFSSKYGGQPIWWTTYRKTTDGDKEAVTPWSCTCVENKEKDREEFVKEIQVSL